MDKLKLVDHIDENDEEAILEACRRGETLITEESLNKRLKEEILDQQAEDVLGAKVASECYSDELTLNLTGLPRQCYHCGSWARYDVSKKSTCCVVECLNCHKEFEIIRNMKHSRSIK